MSDAKSYRDPTLSVAGLSALEAAIGAALKLDPGTQQKLLQLDGRVFSIECTEPALHIYIAINKNSLELRHQWEGRPTTTISGPATEFAKVVAADDKGAALVNSGLSLIGDSQALLELQEILADIDLDWESALSEVIGDVPAHLIGKTARHVSAWGKQARETFLRHLEEFIHEEARLSPSKLEMDDFISDVQKLALDSERFTARLQKLTAKIAKQSAAQAARKQPQDSGND